MDIGKILSYRYPNAHGGGIDYDNNETEITYWNEAKLGTQPTTDQLRSWWLAAEKDDRRKKVKQAASREYRSLWMVEGEYDEVEHDDLIERRTLAKIPTGPGLTAAQKATSDRMDSIKAKRLDLWRQVNQLEQGVNETLEQAVERVRAISW